ncbi:MAG: SpoIIE family protein phosphatase [Desulfobacterales bacterium]|nr:SpoIIE family protein phosphatase [Desulfobacterales bacterium]
MGSLDYDKAVKISKHVFWVGTYDPGDRFQCNSYLIVIDDRGILIDPGSNLYFESLIHKIRDIIALKHISHIILQHQDPDICANIVQLTQKLTSGGNQDFKIYTHERNAVLIRHYGGQLTFEFTNALPKGKLVFSDKYELECIHTPYLHAPGAIATYFKTDKILFSSDIFGGMTENWQLFAGNNYFDQIISFHQEYMPAKEILLFAMTKFERYDIEKIAPQHGSVLNKEQAKAVIEAFKDFECGLYIDQGFRDELEAARKKIEAQNKIMNAELSMAAQFQQSLLPKQPVAGGNNALDTAYWFRPCRQVSGDFLIIDKIDEHHLGIMVIDGVGHGVTPGLAGVQIKTLFDELKQTSLSPATLLRKINAKTFTITEHDIFLTALYAVYDFETSMVSIASAGGVPPAYFNAEKQKGQVVNLVGHPLGVCGGDEFQVTQASFIFKKNDILILQTDGLPDCTDKNNEPFDRIKSQKRLLDLVKKGKSSQEIIDAVMEKVNLHKGKDLEFTDDVTMVVIRKT